MFLNFFLHFFISILLHNYGFLSWINFMSLFLGILTLFLFMDLAYSFLPDWLLD